MEKNAENILDWTAKKTNISILNKWEISKRLPSEVMAKALKFLGHVMRKDQSMEKLMVRGKVDGSRLRGRSSTRWTNAIWKATGKSFVACIHHTEDRDQWRAMVKEATVTMSSWGTTSEQDAP